MAVPAMKKLSIFVVKSDSQPEEIEKNKKIKTSDQTNKYP
jgi:hypothetical protein